MLTLVLLVVASVGPQDDAEPPRAMCANGDEPTGTIGELVHKRRLRSVEVTAGHAVVAFEDEIANERSGPATIELGLGAGGVVRSATIEEPGFASRPARLDDADAARALFDEYTRALTYGAPPEAVKQGEARAAILVSHQNHEPMVSVTLPCSVRRVVVRVEMLLPSVPLDGAWRFSVPGAPGEGVTNDVTVDSARPIRVTIEGAPLRPGAQTTAPTIAEDDEDGALTVLVKPLDGPRLRARGFAMRVEPTPAPPVDAAADAPAAESEAAEVLPVVIAHAELDLPRPLADAPAGLRLVFVVDASVSVGARGLAKAMQMVEAVLDEAPPDARFAIVTAGRKPRVVVPAWRGRDEREMPELTVENGSDVLAALAKARAIASDISLGADGGAGVEVARIIAISDMQLRFVDDDARVRRGFTSKGSAPLTHVVVLPDDADVELPLLWARAFADDDPRAGGPESTGGIWVDGGGEDESTLFPHLIRPTRVDRPVVTFGGQPILVDGGNTSIINSPSDPADVPRGSDGLPLFLVEGSGLRVEAALPVAVPALRELRMGGLLWATTLDERARSDKSLSGLVAVDEVGANLDDALVRTIATREHVVSRVTSLVDVPDSRPAQPDPMGFGMTGGCGCCCCCCSSGCRGWGHSTCGIGVDLREEETLELLLREDARACLVPKAVLSVEFGDSEILGVKASEGGPCVVERFWQRRLDLVTHAPGAFVGHREITVGVDMRDE